MTRAKEHHARDFYVYMRWSRQFRSFLPRDYPLRATGASPTIAAFAAFEDRGDQSVLPQHPRALREALRGKAKLNLQIKEWAAGFYDCGARIWLESELKPEFAWLPEWVWESLLAQAKRVAGAMVAA